MTDAERLLLWSWLIKKKSVADLRRRDLEEYTNLVAKPPSTWQSACAGTVRRFSNEGGLRQPNPEWRPFRAVGSGSARLNTKSWQGLFSNLSVFFNCLISEDYAPGNQVAIIKKNCPYLIQKTGIMRAKRLSALQWDQLAERPNWSPVMSHFHRDHEGNWWFLAFGKGSKERDVSISNEYLDFLKRYREHRGLSPLPSSNSSEPVIESRFANRGVGVRQLRNIVEIALKQACNELMSDGFSQDARDLRDATTHWLRHTGASMEVAAGRSLSHV